MKLTRAAASALAVLLLAAPTAAPPQDHAVIFASADVRGYLGPCGCSENMRGGIARAGHQVLSARAEHPHVFLVDAGDSLLGKIALTPQTLPQEKRKAKALADAYKQMGLAARLSGEKDALAGAAFLKSLKLPEVQPGQVKWLSAGAHRIAVLGAKDRGSLTRAAAAVGKKGAPFVLALFHGTQAEAVKAAQGVDGVHLILASHTGTEFEGEHSRLIKAQVPVAAVQSKGRTLARIDVWFEDGDAPFELLVTQADVERELAALDDRMALLNQQINAPGLAEQAKSLRQQKLAELVERRRVLEAKKIPTPQGKNAYAVRFVPLEATLPGAPAIQKIVEAYDRDVGLLNLAWAKKHGKDCPPPSDEKPGYVGNDGCRACHAAAFAVWNTSKHAHGYATLTEKGKQYHLDCIGCHVTGFSQPGGVCRVDKVAGREGIGCESCHGPGSAHVKIPVKGNIGRGSAEAVCTRCHDPENSPHFDFARYLPQVLGPGHGAKP